MKLFTRLHDFFDKTALCYWRLIWRVGIIIALVSFGVSCFVGFWSQMPMNLGVVGVASSAGCFLGGAIIAMSRSKINQLALIVNLAGKKRDDDLKSRNDELTMRLDKAQIENKRLQSHLDIDAIRQTAEINLAEIDTQITDCKEEWMGDTQGRNIAGFANFSRQKYVGVLRNSFKVKIGVDMKDVRIFNDGAVIHVSPLQPKITISEQKKEWLHRVVLNVPLVRKSKGAGIECIPGESFEKDGYVYEIDRQVRKINAFVDMNIIQSRSQAQEQEVENRILKGEVGKISAECQSVKTRARMFIKDTLAPTGKEIVFEEDVKVLSEQESQTLQYFAENYNERLLASGAPNG